MNDKHQANKRWWNKSSYIWKERSEEEWRNCLTDPSLGFPRGSLNLIQRYIGNFENKTVCVLGSGDNFSSFVLASLGAKITSVDISQEQLSTAAKRAKELSLEIDFIQGDATDCSFLEDNSYDFVCSTNGFFIWVSDLNSLLKEIFRILRPNGHFMCYDIHPFLRPWKEKNKPGYIEMDKPYFNSEPIASYYNKQSSEFLEIQEGKQEIVTNNIDVAYEHHWTLSDIINPLLDSGLELLTILEEPAESDFYEKTNFTKEVREEEFLDWTINPLAGLPSWLTMIAKK